MLGSALALTLGLILLVPLVLIAMARIEEIAAIAFGRGARRLIVKGMPMVPATIGEAVTFPKVSIHVPAYFEPPDMLKQTLDAVSRLDYPNFECVVIINNTPDPEFWQPIQDHCRALGERFKFINAEKVVFTGKKTEKKLYHWHTGHPGGIKTRTPRQIIEGKFPERIVEKAVERMLPRGPLGRKQLGNLHVYKGPDHPHAAQSPAPLDIAAMNPKNSRSA